MKQKDLQELFVQYCTTLHIKSECSRFEGGNYILAEKGTYYLASSRLQKGNNCAIVRNNGDGTIGIHYGYVSPERMAGYLDAAIENAAANKNTPAMFIVIEKHGGPEYATIVTDTDGTNKVFYTRSEAEGEASDCQDAMIIEMD